MRVYVSLLASTLYLNFCLSISRLCHALCPPQAYACRSLRPFACVVASVPFVDCLDVTSCEMHPCDAGLLDAYPFSTLCNVACHACFVPPVWLSLLLCTLFARLPTCSCMSPCLLVLSILQSNGTMNIRSKPTFVLLDTFFRLITCLFVLSYAQHALFAPIWLSLLVCSLYTLLISLCFFLCLFAGLFPCLLHVNS